MAIDVTFTVPKSNTGTYSIPVGVGGGGGVLSNASMGNVLNNITIGAGKIPSHLIDASVLNHFIQDHQIQGQTIMAEYILPPDYLGMDPPEIKKLLIEKLVQEMYKASNIEFTQMKRVETDEMVYRARVHVVPDTQVRIIREIKDARKAT